MIKRSILLFLLGLFITVEAASQGILKNLTLKSPEGKIVAVDTLMKNKVIVVCFWSTTCKPCLGELNALTEIRDRWEGKVRIWAVAIDDTRSVAKVKSLACARKWPFEVFLDLKKEMFRLLNLTGIPASLIFSQKGKVVFRHTGYTPGDESILIGEALSHLTAE